MGTISFIWTRVFLFINNVKRLIAPVFHYFFKGQDPIDVFLITVIALIILTLLWGYIQQVRKYTVDWWTLKIFSLPPLAKLLQAKLEKDLSSTKHEMTSEYQNVTKKLPTEPWKEETVKNKLAK